MALTKKELLQSGAVSHQQALVKRLQERRVLPPRKIMIPGGKTMLEELGQEDMESAIYNWLRGCRAFTQVTLSFAKNPDSYQCKVTKVRDFDDSNPREIWETHPEGKEYLARGLAEVINTFSPVKVVAKKDGIWVYEDVNNSFSPYKAVTEDDVAAQQKLVAEIKAEMEEEGQDPETFEYTELQPGDQVPADEWEPFIEFLPKKLQEYGR